MDVTGNLECEWHYSLDIFIYPVLNEIISILQLIPQGMCALKVSRLKSGFYCVAYSDAATQSYHD